MQATGVRQATCKGSLIFFNNGVFYRLFLLPLFIPNISGKSQNLGRKTVPKMAKYPSSEFSETFYQYGFQDIRGEPQEILARRLAICQNKIEKT